MAVRFQLRRDTAANWTSANSVLALGEPGVETDTLKVKVGDGSTAWNSLAYSITKDFTDLTSTPTTLAGYGITDALALAGLSVTQNAASGSGAITYNNATGVFSYTPPNFEGLNGNFTGSVFADDSTIMVDGVAATLNLANNTTANLPENTNLYYTDARVDAYINASILTTDVSEGTNLYYTDARADARITAASTSDLSEGTNEYFTNARADARITAASIIDLSDADQAVATTDSPTFVNTTLTGYLAGPASFVIDPAAVGDDTGTVVIAGNLQVDGLQTTINSTTVSIDDLNFSIATDAADSAAANGAGITVGGAGATLNYTHATTSWDMNKPLNVTGDIGVSGTVDGVDIQTLNTTAGAALPKAGGTMTGDLLIQKAEPIINLRRSDNDLLPGLRWQGSGGAQAASIRMDGDSGTTNSIVMSTYNGSSVAERLRILTGAADGIQVTGNVGIGTASPTAQLDIQSHMTASGVFTGSISTTTLTVTAVASGTIAVGDRITDASIEPNTVITALGTGTGNTGTYTVSISQTATSQTLRTTSHTKNLLLFKDTDTTASGGTQLGTIEFEGSDSGNEGTKAFITAVTQSASSPAMLAFGTAPSGVVNAQTRLTIDSDGNVGIGVVPHTGWRSEATALQISPLGAIWNTSNYEDFNIGNNVYTDGTEKYIQNDAACKIRLTDAGIMDFRVAVAGSANAAITWNTALAINNNGQVGIGTGYTGSGLLRVGRAPSAGDEGQRTIFADGTHDAITTTGTNYLHNVWIQNNNFDIDSGVTDSGYRIGLNIEGYHDNSNLAGTLATQKNVWSRNGNNSGGAGTITNSYNMHLETLDGGGITITNNYGLYQTGAGTKNYFEGDVGIGTADPGTLLHVKGAAALTGTTGGAAGLSIAYDGGNSSPLYFGTETTSAQKSMYMSGYWIYLRGHQNEGIRFVYSQGSGSAPRSDQYEFKYNSATRPTGNTTWDGFSDVRAKENVQNITGALDTISQLRPVVFDWTDDYADTMNMFEMDETDPKSYNWTSVKENGYDLIRKNGKIGFIAQEFETVFPKDITELEVQLGDEKVEDFKTVNYDSLIPTLTKAIQEQQAQIQALQQRLDDLEG